MYGEVFCYKTLATHVLNLMFNKYCFLHPLIPYALTMITGDLPTLFCPRIQYFFAIFMIKKSDSRTMDSIYLR